MFNVICAGCEDYSALTLGKVYEVFGFYGDVYVVVNDKGKHYTYPMRLFKDTVVKPPLGLKPRKIYWEELNHHRSQDIIAAMQRRLEAKMDIPVEWCKELIDLVIAGDKNE